MWAGLIAIRWRVACCCVNMAGPSVRRQLSTRTDYRHGRKLISTCYLLIVSSIGLTVYAVSAHLPEPLLLQ